MKVPQSYPYVRAMRQRWWLTLGLPALLAIVVYLYFVQSPLYTATSTVRFEESATVRIGTFEELLTSRPVLERVTQEVQIAETAAEVRSQISAKRVFGTKLYRVSMTRSDPDTAARAANALPMAFEEWFVSTRTTEIDMELERLQPEIDELQRGLDTTENERERATLQTAQNALLARRQQLLTEKAALADLVSVIVPAAPPAQPDRRLTTFLPLAAFALGLALSTSVATAWNRIDPRVHSKYEAEDIAGLSTLAVISHGRRGSVRRPRVGPAEQHVAARLQLARSGDGVGSVLVTSPQMVEERGDAALRVGWALAQSGLRTVVVETTEEGDHHLPPREAGPGFRDLLGDPALDPAEAITVVESGRVQLGLLPSGNSQGPLDHFGDRIEKLLTDLNAVADAIVLGGPAIISAPTTLFLAVACDATVLTARLGRTHRDALHEAARRLREIGADPLGLVVTSDRRH